MCSFGIKSDGATSKPCRRSSRDRAIEFSNRFLPKALLVPGMLHVMSNGLQHVTSQLTYFDHWFDQLQVIEQLWKNGRLPRFINYCLKPAAPEHIAAIVFPKEAGLFVRQKVERGKPFLLAPCRFAALLESILEC